MIGYYRKKTINKLVIINSKYFNRNLKLKIDDFENSLYKFKSNTIPNCFKVSFISEL